MTGERIKKIEQLQVKSIAQELIKSSLEAQAPLL